MAIEILHHISFRLPNPPPLPASLATYTQLGDFLDEDEFKIRGDIRGAPTLEILDALFEKGVRLSSPIWDLSFKGDAKNACAYTIELSPAGDDRGVDLLNPCDDWLDPTAAPMDAQLRSDRDAVLSKKPQGPLTLLGNNLLAAASAVQALQLTPTAAVLVKGKPVNWHVVQPAARSVLDPFLRFCRPDERPYRAHQANIAKAGADLRFGLAIEAESCGSNNCANLYLMDLDSAARIMPPNRITLGDLELAPVYPADSPEALVVRAITERMNRLIE
jgi:hypothetical protein